MCGCQSAYATSGEFQRNPNLDFDVLPNFSDRKERKNSFIDSAAEDVAEEELRIHHPIPGHRWEISQPSDLFSAFCSHTHDRYSAFLTLNCELRNRIECDEHIVDSIPSVAKRI